MKYFVDSNDKLFWNRRLPVYIRIASSPSDTGYVMKSEVTRQYSNPYFFDSEGYHRIRTDWATDQKTGEMVYPQVEVIWEVYADGLAPESKIHFNKNSKSAKGDDEIYGDSLTFEIKSQDATSGIGQIYYSVNGEDYKLYNSPVTLDNEGAQIIKYYAVDKVGNAEKPKEKKFSTDLTPPKTYYNITGIANGEIIATNTKIYLSAEDSSSKVQATYYKIDDQPYSLYKKNSNIPVSQLSDGEHKLSFYSVDVVGNKEEETVFQFYLDKTAPIIAADILGDRYLMDDKIFFSGRSKMKLTAIDNKAGVDEIFYSINGDKFNKYDQPFYLPSIPGVHIVRYFATDKMKNNSDAGTSKFEQYKHVVSRIYVDLTGPVLSYEITGDKYKTRDTIFISERNVIKFKAVDSESGLQFISYSVNRDPDETKYEGSLQFKDQGPKQISFFGYDNVNNRNRADFVVYVDNEGPEIKYNFSITSKGNKDSLDVYPSHVLLYLAATDKTIGAKDIFYSLNGATEQKYNLSMNGFIKGEINEVKIRATDFLNNSSTQTIRFFVE